MSNIFSAKRRFVLRETLSAVCKSIFLRPNFRKKEHFPDRLMFCKRNLTVCSFTATTMTTSCNWIFSPMWKIDESRWMLCDKNLHVKTCGKFINHAQDVVRISVGSAKRANRHHVGKASMLHHLEPTEEVKFLGIDWKLNRMTSKSYDCWSIAYYVGFRSALASNWSGADFDGWVCEKRVFSSCRSVSDHKNKNKNKTDAERSSGADLWQVVRCHFGFSGQSHLWLITGHKNKQKAVFNEIFVYAARVAKSRGNDGVEESDWHRNRVYGRRAIVRFAALCRQFSSANLSGLKCVRNIMKQLISQRLSRYL